MNLTCVNSLSKAVARSTGSLKVRVAKKGNGRFNHYTPFCSTLIGVRFAT